MLVLSEPLQYMANWDECIAGRIYVALMSQLWSKNSLNKLPGQEFLLHNHA